MKSTENRIIVEEDFRICESSVVQLSQKMPKAMDGHVSKQEWETFCSKIDKDLKRLPYIRTVVLRLLFLYLVIMAALYLIFEHFNLLEEYRTFPLWAEILVSVGILVVVTSLYIIWARTTTINAIKKHSSNLTHGVCPGLGLKCHLPFCQLTGGMAKGWYISVHPKVERTETV